MKSDLIKVSVDDEHGQILFEDFIEKDDTDEFVNSFVKFIEGVDFKENELELHIKKYTEV